MTRQERLEELAFALGGAEAMASDAVRHFPFDVSVDEFCCAASYANEALDHLAALEQQAITDYLADVPLPEGWTERPDQWGGVFYADEAGVERVLATERGVDAIRKPRHWPAIPQAVLVRAAVQCGRLREAGRS